MGKEINHLAFDQDAEQEFMIRLYQETKILKQYIHDRVMDHSTQAFIGLEIEAWILDKKMNITPRNQDLIKRIHSELIVSELSKFNFEMNTPPFALSGNVLDQVKSMLSHLWNKCQIHAHELDLETIFIGIAPTANDQLMTYDVISDSNRYRALNDRLRQLREHPAELNINGDNVCLRLTLQNLIFAAICTSLQIHLKTSIDQITNAYNAAQLASAPVLAVSGNSPFVNGLDLWEETRIAVFEQSVSLAVFRCNDGWEVGQASFGSGYARSSILELFLENFTHFPVILPELMDTKPEALEHLKMHNGTIWRWNRPVIGFSEQNIPHVRIELRALPSGPTIDDMVANLAFFLGLVLYYSSEYHTISDYPSYSMIRSNFYKVAQRGLNARFQMENQNTVLAKDIIQNDLIQKAKSALICVGLDKEDVRYYLDEVIGHRAKTGQTGSCWQKTFIKKYGNDFHAMTKAYIEWQASKKPVSYWKV